MDDVLVDLAPWSVERFPYTVAGSRALRDRLVETGMAVAGADEEAWAAWEERVVRLG
ncbi:hypothetical protein HNR00_003133 [Methylorubrum rhodinum]|uniref:Uncharacterized protein n=1 Tax=Methylorubrum rhodinum TaxID=29428 RepID=A0A840ZNS9_9HYPH|nr:hypothetical protein [Methylorubrum rhodinum]MBB5758413.1 hypothetical protein [Methylorubrum rhodinum]